MQITVQIKELRERFSLILPLLVRIQSKFLTIRTLHILNSAIEVIIHDRLLVFSIGQQLSNSMQRRYQVPTQPVFPQQINQQHLIHQQFQCQVLVYLYRNALAKIKLDTFDGDLTKWTDWNSRFQFVIGQAPLSSSKTIAYLQSLVKGIAKDVIQSVGCDGNHYENVIAELKRRFGRTTVIVGTMIQQLIQHLPLYPIDLTHESIFLPLTRR